MSVLHGIRRNLLALGALLLTSASQSTPPPAAFGLLPDVVDAAISPDGTQIAIINRVDDQYAIRIIASDLTEEKPRLALLDGNARPIWVRWANRHQLLTGFGITESYWGIPVSSAFIYTLDVRTMHGKTLIEPPEAVSRTKNAEVVDMLPQDPEHILMAFSDEYLGNPGVHKVNVTTGNYRRVQRGRANIQSWFADRSGVIRAGQGVRKPKADGIEYELILREVDGDSWISSDEFPDLDADSKIFGFTDDPNELVIGSYLGKNTMGAYTYNIADRRVIETIFHHDRYDIENVLFHPRTYEVSEVTYVADAPARAAVSES